MLLNIRHETAYRYAKPVQFCPHRLLIRPREGHDVQIRSSNLTIEPANRLRWSHDVFDNSVAVAEFSQAADQLRIVSELSLEQYNVDPFDFIIAPHAREMPFAYAKEENEDLTPYKNIDFPEDEKALMNWARPFLSAKKTAQTLDFLVALNRSVTLYFQYQRREEPGIQGPAETLRKRSGSCRDFALLFMEAARRMGFAARYVSGYLCQPSSDAPYAEMAGATHAWAEIYLPGAGWKGFDPTCGMLAAGSHARIAVTRKPSQALPISGTFIGEPNAALGMTVQVEARSESSSP